MSSHGWRLASELKVILDIYRVAILVGPFWLSLLSKDSWGKALKYSFSHQELLSSVALYGFWSSHWIICTQLSPLYLQYGIINTFCTEGHRSDISQISSGRNKFMLLNIFTYFADWGMNQVLYSEERLQRKHHVTIAYSFELNVRSMQFWVLFFCLFPLGEIKPAGRTLWDFPAFLWRLMVTLSLALCFQALEPASLFPRAVLPCFPVLLLRWYQRWPPLLKFDFSCSWNPGCWWV